MPWKAASVKDQLRRIATTYPVVDFAYATSDGALHSVRTFEEQEYPKQYYRRMAESPNQDGNDTATEHAVTEATGAAAGDRLAEHQDGQERPTEQHVVFHENQRDVSFDSLFGRYLSGAKRIVVTDPYLRLFYQVRNLMELMETISKLHDAGDEVAVHVVTVEDDFRGEQQCENLDKIAEACSRVGIQMTWAYDASGTLHDRDITTDHGWKIVLSRGLDIFQRYELNDAFSFDNRLQEHRQCKEFNVTYVAVDVSDSA